MFWKFRLMAIAKKSVGSGKRVLYSIAGTKNWGLMNVNLW